MTLFRLNDAIHLVPDRIFSLSLNKVIEFGDCLSHGPCTTNPKRHAELRRAYWKELIDDTSLALAPPMRSAYRRRAKTWIASWILSQDQLLQRLFRWPKSLPIVLWTSQAWIESLFLWWAFDALQIAQVDGDRLILVQSPRRNYIGHLCADELARLFEARQPVGRRRLKAGASLWRKFASRSPIAFDDARRKGDTSFPGLAEISEAWGDWFPSIDSRDRVWLSRFDRLLLGQLRERTWKRPVDLIHGELFRFLENCGDFLVVRRLVQWQRHCADSPLVVARPREDGLNSFTRVEYRLTSAGKRLLDEGLDSPRNAPVQFVGGSAAYGPRSLWVRRKTRRGWRFEILH